MVDLWTCTLAYGSCLCSSRNADGPDFELRIERIGLHSRSSRRLLGSPQVLHIPQREEAVSHERAGIAPARQL